MPSVLALWTALTAALGATGAPSPDAAPPPPPPDQDKTEPGVVPLVGGDTDYGIGAGYLASVAGLRPDAEPFAWRVESAGFISFKATDAGDVDSLGSWVSPYQDYYGLVQVPRFLHRRLRLDLRPSFTRETTQHYYGLGNASVAPPDEIPSRDFYRFRGSPQVGDHLPYQYAQINLTNRVYAAVLPERLVLAARVVGWTSRGPRTRGRSAPT